MESLQIVEAAEAAATEHGSMDASASATEHAASPRDVLRHRSDLRIEVEFKNGMWWTMPLELSMEILQKWRLGMREVSFVWDWQGSRDGSFRPEGESTVYSRYSLDFRTMRQRNLDNDRIRTVRVVYVVA